MRYSIRNRPGACRRGTPAAVTLTALVLAVTLTACSSTTSSPPSTTGSSGSTSGIPASAFSDTTGLTPTTVSIGNVSTLFEGLFKGAYVGTEAYAAYVNSQGGVHGRKILVDSYDDGYAGAPNKQYTQEAAQKDFALVGGFSTFDSFGGTVLAADPGVPNVTVSLDTATGALPNSFSPQPASGGWQLGPLVYFQKKFPADVKHVGALIADVPSAISKWVAENAAMNSLGYKVVYDPQFGITQTDFTQYVISMRNAGVKILFVEQMPENYAAAVVKALNQQDYHPVVVFGASTYSEALVPNSGGAAAIDGSYFDQAASLYLGEDSSAIPAVSTFLSWVQKVSPGFKADLYTLYGWTSAELFTQALQAAGPNPTRGSLLEQLRKITSFNAGNLLATANPAGKVPASCYIVGHIVNGQFQRLDDPPVTGSTHGYRCDEPYYYYPPKT